MKPALVSGKTTTSPLSRIATWPGAIAEPTRTRALSLMMRLGPGGPWGPVGPTAPFSPWGPLGPTGPSDPIGPATPCIPCSPGEPGIPGGPGSPFGPCKPWSPLGSLVGFRHGHNMAHSARAPGRATLLAGWRRREGRSRRPFGPLMRRLGPIYITTAIRRRSSNGTALKAYLPPPGWQGVMATAV
jgi:hypothetical protein